MKTVREIALWVTVGVVLLIVVVWCWAWLLTGRIDFWNAPWL